MRISDWSSDVCSSDLLDLKPHREIGQVKVGKIPFARKVESFLLVRPIPSNSFEENSPPRLRPRPECYSLEEAWQGFDRRCHISVLSCFAADPGMIFCISRRSASVSGRSEEHTSALQSLMRISYAVFCLTTKSYQR